NSILFDSNNIISSGKDILTISSGEQNTMSTWLIDIPMNVNEGLIKHTITFYDQYQAINFASHSASTLNIQLPNSTINKWLVH
ncbi:MAG: hypothetical protein ACP5I1_10865, partial [Candidatus Hinthialibacter sp.]